MKKTGGLVLLALVASFAFGCAAPDEEDEIEIKLAPIHEVSIAIAESFPEQIFVYIKGGLPDGCTTFHGLAIDRDGKDVNITVTIARPRDAVCTQVYGYFEQNINLGSDFVSGETYDVNVNDVTERFTYP